MGCNKFRSKSRKLCSGDLKDLIEIQQRVLKPPQPGQMSGTEIFTTIKSVWAFANTVRGTSRFASVNIDENATHLWYIRYDPDLDIETKNNFILYESRRFSIIDVTNDDENDNFLIIQTRETGDDDKEAASA